MIRRFAFRAVPVLIVGAAALAQGASRPANSEKRLPSRLAFYRSWRPLEGSAREVPVPLYVLCSFPGQAEIDRRTRETKASFGPHAQHYVRVYANPVAEGTLREEATSFVPGAILIKAKLQLSEDLTPEGFGVMIKHGPGAFDTSGGWEFRYYPEPKDADYSHCVACHHQGAPRDYVFGRLDR